MLIQDILPPQQVRALKELYLRAPTRTRAKVAHHIKVH